MEAPKKKSSEHRVEVYAFVQKILGRELTPIEHKGLKGLMIAYVEDCGAAMYATKIGQIKAEATAKTKPKPVVKKP